MQLRCWLQWQLLPTCHIRIAVRLQDELSEIRAIYAVAYWLICQDAFACGSQLGLPRRR